MSLNKPCPNQLGKRYSKADQVTSPTIPSSTSPFFSEIVLQRFLSLNQISHQFDWVDILMTAEVSEQHFEAGERQSHHYGGAREV